MGSGGGEFVPGTVPVHVGTHHEGRALGAGDQAASAATASSSGAAPIPSHDPTSGTSPTEGPNTSSGKSRNVGPRCGSIASRTASCTIAPACAGSVTVAAILVIDDTIGTWSSSCSEPAPQRPCGARPPSTTTGDPLKCADVIADTPLVMPGPAVSAANPGRRVSLAYASAANVADCLVAGVDHAHCLVTGGVVQRPDVAAVECEHHIGAVGTDALRLLADRRAPKFLPCHKTVTRA
jgi:hypothetical protein